PFYYLKQNDLVYVEPNKARSGQREINQNRSIGTFASIVSVLTSLAILIFK
ncbi:MAG TPA: BexD/CtrA/VexA family polysaccharide export protein, partial [Clostridiales bacterium]|nr:BexD/CtrA/VexA family polysaccharide export protein [Clostridiales bacterium]